jgi:hypothetical protein
MVSRVKMCGAGCGVECAYWGKMSLPSIDVYNGLGHGGRTLWPSSWMSQEGWKAAAVCRVPNERARLFWGWWL